MSAKSRAPAAAGNYASGASAAAAAGAAVYYATPTDTETIDMSTGFPDVNPATGLPTVGGMGTQDVAGNSWCTTDAFAYTPEPDSFVADTYTPDSFSGSDDF